MGRRGGSDARLNCGLREVQGGRKELGRGFRVKGGRWCSGTERRCGRGSLSGKGGRRSCVGGRRWGRWGRWCS